MFMGMCIGMFIRRYVRVCMRICMVMSICMCICMCLHMHMRMRMSRIVNMHSGIGMIIRMVQLRGVCRVYVHGGMGTGARV